jgi:N-acetylmuramoyl-L-alanine amidase
MGQDQSRKGRDFMRESWWWVLLRRQIIGRRSGGWLALVVLSFVVAIGLYKWTDSGFRTAWNMPLAGKVIVLDPGHGGPDGGAVSADGLVEKDVTLPITFYLRDYLQEAGALVVLTRESDRDLAEEGTKGLSRRKTQDLFSRARLIKSSRADALISIHLNAIPSSRWSGAQTFYHPSREANKRLATWIQKELVHKLGNTTRLSKQNGEVFLLKTSPVPAALVEVGFLSNPQEAAMLRDEGYQKKLAAAIYYGILRFFSGERLPDEER